MTSPLGYSMPSGFSSAVVERRQDDDSSYFSAKPRYTNQLKVWDKDLETVAYVDIVKRPGVEKYTHCSHKIVTGRAPTDENDRGGLDIDDDLSFSDLRDSHFKNVRFYNVLTGSNCDKAVFDNVSFEVNIGSVSDVFSGAVLTGVTFSDVMFATERFGNVDFSHVAEMVSVSIKEILQTHGLSAASNKEPLPPQTQASILKFAEDLMEEWRVVGLTPFKVLKAPIPAEEFLPAPSGSIPESLLKQYLPDPSDRNDLDDAEMSPYYNPFASCYVDVTANEEFRPSPASVDVSKTNTRRNWRRGLFYSVYSNTIEPCYLVICFKRSGSNDQYGQIRAPFRLRFQDQG